MKLFDILGREMATRNLRSVNAFARFLGMSKEHIRAILKGHVPKDKSLIKIAKKLGISATPLILAAHQ
jgi:transcriptional regulator with XRE-family HTH domain